MIAQDIQVSEIIPYSNNARFNDNAIEVVRESIQKYGFNQPLVVTQKGGKYEIVVGHTRFLAIKELGCESVPCIVIDLPEDKIKQYRIADNSIAEFSSWDDMKLIRELQSMDIPRDLDFLFNGCVDKIMGVHSQKEARDQDENEQADKMESCVMVCSSVPFNESDVETVPDSANEEVVINTVQSPVPIGSGEVLKKKAENYRNMLRNIEQERIASNRQYLDITCPKCGRKFTIAKRGV